MLVGRDQLNDVASVKVLEVGCGVDEGEIKEYDTSEVDEDEAVEVGVGNPELKDVASVKVFEVDSSVDFVDEERERVLDGFHGVRVCVSVRV
jgi:hypothetical protein